MGSTGRIGHARREIAWLGHVLSRREFLRVAAGAGLGVMGAQLATAVGRVEAADAGSTAASDPIGDLAEALGYDAERIFRFVADEVRYEPYAGILRGARGTLASRAGNSADQALLMAALLDASLLPVRFAIGPIDEPVAEAIVDGTTADVEAIRRHAADALVGSVPGRQHVALTLAPEQQALLDAAEADAERVTSWAQDGLLSTVERIEGLLREAGVNPVPGFTPMPELERAGHVWVQMASAAAWVDLDPTPPGATFGVALTTERETVDVLPDELAHHVDLTIIGERLEDGSLTEQVLLGLSETAEALAGVPLMVLNADPQGLSALGVAIAGALSSGTAYAPTIVLADEAIVGAHPIVLGSAGGAADGALGGDLLAPDSGADETTAEWVEVTVRAPGAEPVVIRRAIFDRIGPARRAAGGVTAADIAPLEMVDDPDGRSHALPALNTHWLTVSNGLPSATDSVLSVGPDDLRGGTLASQLQHLVTAALGVEMASAAGIRPFVDAPNVVAYSMSLRAAPGGPPIVETAVDIWHRSHGVGRVAGVDAALTPGLLAGVLPHVAERIVGGEIAGARSQTTAVADPAAGGGPVEDGFTSVGAVFETADAEGIAWQVLRGTGATDGLAWDGSARARLEAWLASGWVAVAPVRPVTLGGRERIGWWLYHPTSGRLLDELDDGRGVSLTEALARLKGVMDGLPLWARIGLCIATLFRGAFAILTLGIRAIEGRLLGWGTLLAASSAISAPWTYRGLRC